MGQRRLLWLDRVHPGGAGLMEGCGIIAGLPQMVAAPLVEESFARAEILSSTVGIIQGHLSIVGKQFWFLSEFSILGFPRRCCCTVMGRALALDMSETRGPLPKALPSVVEGVSVFSKARALGSLPLKIFREVEMVEGLV